MAEITVTLRIWDETYQFPGHYAVCPRCEGTGKVTNPNIGAITSEEWDRNWCPDEQEAYVAGRYDVTCPTCKGKRVMPSIDPARFTAVNRAAYAEYRGMCDARDECLATEAAERAFGC